MAVHSYSVLTRDPSVNDTTPPIIVCFELLSASAATLPTLHSIDGFFFLQSPINLLASSLILSNALARRALAVSTIRLCS